MLEKRVKARSCQELIEEFRENKKIYFPEILKFKGVGDRDVYNPSTPTYFNEEIILAGRVEKRSEINSRAIFFQPVENEPGTWIKRQNTRQFDLEDPFLTYINEELIMGGVRIAKKGGRVTEWTTDFFRGKTLNKLKKFASGPSHMKDIRLLQLENGKIAVFTRPRGQEVIDKCGDIARIGFVVLDSLDELGPEIITGAPLLEGQFLSDEWGGCNQLHLLKNGLIGIVGHISYGEEFNGEHILHYYGMAFVIDPETRKKSQVKIIISRDCFPEGPAKEPRLKDVTFTAGIVRHSNGLATIYTGLSDCQVGKAIIADPFTEYEKL